MRVAVIAPLIFGSSGYARAGRSLLLALERCGADIRLVGANPRWDGIIDEEAYARIRSYYAKTWEPDIQFNLAPQCYFKFSFDRAYKIGFSMFETLNNPPRFADACALCDEVWVPSSFCFQTFSQNVPKHKLAVMPLGVDLAVYSPGPSSMRVTDPTGTEFDYLFGIICGYSARKGVDLLILAFLEAFREEDNVALLIKGDRFGGKLFPQDIDSFLRREGQLFDALTPHQKKRVLEATANKNLPTILYSFDIELTDRDIVELEKALDCLVFPSRGEGFGLPPLECMALEKPVIATQATGLVDMLSEEFSYPLRNKGFKVEPRCDWITGSTREYVGGLFADPDYDHLVELMKHVFTHKKEAKAKGKKARQFVVENFDIDLVARRIFRRMESILLGRDDIEDFWPYTSHTRASTSSNA